jgi:hypothetical protein
LLPDRSGGMWKEKRTMVVTIRLGENAVKELRAIAEADRRKLGNYLAMVIEDHLEAVKRRKQPRKAKPQ